MIYNKLEKENAQNSAQLNDAQLTAISYDALNCELLNFVLNQLNSS